MSLDDDWAESLEWGKAHQAARSVVFLTRPESIRLALAWPAVPRELVDVPDPFDRPRPGATSLEHLQWCWQFVSFDSSDWARLADVSRPETGAQGLMLVENGLIFPDGTVHTVAEKYAESVALQMLQKATGIKPKKKAAKAEADAS